MKNNTAEIAAAAAPEVADAQACEALIARTSVSTDAELQVAISWIAEIKRKAEAVDEKRRSFVDPLRRVIDEINEFFRPALDSLKGAETVLKGKVSEHMEACEAQRRNLLAQVAGAEPGDRTALVEAAGATTPAKVEGMSVRETWTGEVSDAAALTQWIVVNRRFELLSINERALVALTQAAGRDPAIPGWTATLKRTVAVTSGRVRR